MTFRLGFLQKLRARFSRKAPPGIDDAELVRLQKAIGYWFNDSSLLVRALVHRSYATNGQQSPDPGASNERLEFLGDSVLSLVVNKHLYDHFPDKREGELTKMKSVIVSKPILSRYSRRINLGGYILLSENAQKSGVAEMESVLADSLEAVFGAVFLDGGFEPAQAFIRHLLLSDAHEIFDDEDNINYKSLLQEYIQALHKVPPRYQVRATRGPEHDKEFAVEVGVRGNVLARGVGKTKKLAEQEAARVAYKKLLNDESADEDE